MLRFLHVGFILYHPKMKFQKTVVFQIYLKPKTVSNQSGGLALLLKVKTDARVMITTNIDISDSLPNG